MNDAVIGAITGYGPEQIQYWINSLNRSGFTGSKYLLCYNIDKTTIDWASARGIKCVSLGFDPAGGSLYYRDNFNIVVERFYHLWVLFRTVIHEHPYRFIITTDVKDVIFQYNPSQWLENNLLPENDILLSSEGLKYKDEPWGNHNLFEAYGHYIHGHYKDKEIVNCGVLAGRANAMIDLFLNIYLACGRAPEFVKGGGGPDQAALNILMGLYPYTETTQISRSEDVWAAQLGTTGDPSKISAFTPHLLYEPPIYREGTFYSGKHPQMQYCVVHQWDRMSPEVVQQVKEKYS